MLSQIASATIQCGSKKNSEKSKSLSACSTKNSATSLSQSQEIKFLNTSATPFLTNSKRSISTTSDWPRKNLDMDQEKQRLGVKKPLGHTNSFSGSTLPKYGVDPKAKHEAELAK